MKASTLFIGLLAALAISLMGANYSLYQNLDAARAASCPRT